MQNMNSNKDCIKKNQLFFIIVHGSNNAFYFYWVEGISEVARETWPK